MGEKFYQCQPRTEGIETNNVEVKYVDDSWNKIIIDGKDEYVDSLSWYTASRAVDKTDKKRISESKEGKDKIKTSLDGAGILLIVFLRLAFRMIRNRFAWGFAPYHWAFVAVYCLQSLQMNFFDRITIEYRMASGTSLVLISECLSRELHSYTDTFVEELGVPFFRYSLRCLVSGLLVMVMMFTQGCGSRTGTILAIFLAISPEQIEGKEMELNYSELYSTLLESTGLFFGGLLGNSIALTLLSHNLKKNVVIYILISLSVSSLSLFSLILPSVEYLIYGFECQIGSLYGLLFGRICIRKIGGSYIKKKVFGFVVGILCLYLAGWKFYINFDNDMVYKRIWTVRLFGIVILVVSEALRFHHIKTTNTPVKNIKESLRILELRREEKSESDDILNKKESSMPTKLVLMDYAGHDLYHATHHVFMSNYSIYFMVFNLVDLAECLGSWEGEREQLKKIQFWLQSVCSHAKKPNFYIFMVGTHKASVTEENISQIDAWLSKKLIQTYGNYISIRQSGRWVYAIENSSQRDSETSQLMKDVWLAAYQCMSKENYPLEWRKLKIIIENYREKGTFLIKYSELKRKTQEFFYKKNDNINKRINESNENSKEISDCEFKKMLSFYVKNGDIVWNDFEIESEVYIVLDPSFLVDIFKVFLHVGNRSINAPVLRSPRIKKENNWLILHFLEIVTNLIGDHKIRQPNNYRLSKGYDQLEEQILNETGIAFKNLIERTLKKIGICEDSIETVIMLLQSYDLLCPTGKRRKPGFFHHEIDETFLLPFRLQHLKDASSLWQHSETDKIFYFGFKNNSPVEILFLRLLIQCATRSEKIFQDEDSTKTFIYKNIGRFLEDDVSYLLECTTKMSSNASSETPIIKIYVREAMWNKVQLLANKIYKSVKNIRDRDFEWLDFSLIYENGPDNLTTLVSSKSKNLDFPSEIIFPNKNSIDNLLQLLKQNLIELTENMDGQYVALYLYQADVINKKLYEEINSCPTPFEKNTKILEVVMSRGETPGVTELINAFHQAGQSPSGFN